MNFLFVLNVFVFLYFLFYGPVILLFTVPRFLPYSFSDPSNHRVYHVAGGGDIHAVCWTIIGIISTILTIGLISSWIKVFKNPFFGKKIVLYSILNIFQAFFCLCLPIEATFSRSRVHSISDFINWLVTDGYMESIITLTIILILVINVFYFKRFIEKHIK